MLRCLYTLPGVSRESNVLWTGPTYLFSVTNLLSMGTQSLTSHRGPPHSRYVADLDVP